MIDLVKALRSRATWETATSITEPHQHIDWMAAEEITRLRAELADYKDAAASEAERVNELTAENKTLREENALMLEDIGRHKKVIDNLSRAWLYWKDRCEQFIDENARMREALKPFAARIDSLEKSPLTKHACAAMVEIEHLRAARAAIREGGEDE